MLQPHSSESLQIDPVQGKYQACYTVTKPSYAESPSAKPGSCTMDTSFEGDISSDHTAAVWKASLEYLGSSLRDKFDHEKGFNDENIFQVSPVPRDAGGEIEVREIVSKNTILLAEEKEQLCRGLQKCKELQRLFAGLYYTFAQEIFEELTVLFYQALQKYSTFKETTKLSEQLRKFMAPSFTDINFDLDEIGQVEQPDVYLHQDDEQVKEKADEAASEIAGCYVMSTKIRFLNLKQAETIKERSNNIRCEFEKFVEILTRAVFFCAEGFFYHPSTQALDLHECGSISFSEKSIGSEEQFQTGRKRRNT